MPNKPLELQATGNSSNPVVPPQTLPQALNFSAPPAQPAGSQSLGLLGALAGLGMNIASAVQGRGGAAGQGVLQFANQQLDQYARNERQSQEVADAEKQAKALLKQANDAGIKGSDLGVVTSLLEARDVPAARSEIDRLLSVMRQRRQEGKAEKELALREAMELRRQTQEAAAGHPAARISKVAELLDKDVSPDVMTNAGSLETLLGGLKDDKGRILYGNAKERKAIAKQIVSSYREADPSALARMLGYGGSKEEKDGYKKAAINKFLQSQITPEAVEDYKTVRQQLDQYNDAVVQLKGNPKAPRAAAPGTKAAPVQPPAPKDAQAARDPIADLKAAAKAGNAKAKAYLDSKKIAY